MGVTIAKNSSFLGVELIRVRNVLKAWHKGDRSDIFRLAKRKDIDLDPRTVMVLLEELRDRGLLGPEDQAYGPPKDGLTEAGLALAGASAATRVPKSQARVVLERFLDNCVSVNERTDLPFEICKIWLFGSMLDPARDKVGDIDLVVEQRRPLKYKDGEHAMRRYGELAKEMGAPPQSGLMSILGDQIFVGRQLLHDGRRHPLLSMNEINDLRDMACPCQLIFDAVRGGRVSDQILDCHPTSTGRSSSIGEKRGMPNFAEGRQPLMPVPITLAASHYIDYATLRAIGPWHEDSPRYKIINNHVSNMAVVAEGIQSPRHDVNVLTRRFNFLNCDGRSRFGLLLIERNLIDPGDLRSGFKHRPVAATLVERSLQQKESTISYKLDVVDADHLGRTVEFRHSLAFAWWLNLVVTTDIERILRREAETGANYDVQVNLGFSSQKSVAAELNAMNTFSEHNYIKEVRARLKNKTV